MTDTLAGLLGRFKGKSEKNTLAPDAFKKKLQITFQLGMKNGGAGLI